MQVKRFGQRQLLQLFLNNPLAYRSKVPLQHQLLSNGMLRTMVVHKLHAMILNIAVTRLRRLVMMECNKLEPVKTHYSLLQVCFHQQIMFLL
jgi:hypothetical protein